MHSEKPVIRIGRFSATDEPGCGLTPWQLAEPTASSQGSHLGKFPEQALPCPRAHILPSCLPDHRFHHPPLSGCSHLHMWGPARSTQLPLCCQHPCFLVTLLPGVLGFCPLPIRFFPYLFSGKLPVGQYGQRQQLIYNVIKHIFKKTSYQLQQPQICR